jgi:hypothetical protein
MREYDLSDTNITHVVFNIEPSGRGAAIAEDIFLGDNGRASYVDPQASPASPATSAGASFHGRSPSDNGHGFLDSDSDSSLSPYSYVQDRQQQQQLHSQHSHAASGTHHELEHRQVYATEKH